jgi:starch synthase
LETRLNAPDQKLNQRLRIVMTASEAVPFFKTGGLADVTSALAVALEQRGHDVVLILPDYTAVRRRIADRLPFVADSGLRFSIDMNGSSVPGSVNWTTLPGSHVRVFLVQQADYFSRPELYQENGIDYPDNCERFSFFSRAVVEICRQSVLRPHVIHCNDWQTGIIPGLVATRFASQPGFAQTATVMTIHNMAYQGQFWHLDLPLTGMDWRYFTHHHMEAWGKLNLLKTGLAFSDRITTVSPTYAREICTPEGGHGLDGLLRHRAGDITGILNGIDCNVWNPETDDLIPAHYSAKNFASGKAECKAALQTQLGLPLRPNVPLIGMVSRMADQKGFDLIEACAQDVLADDVQMAFLGTGDPRCEEFIASLGEAYPDKVGVRIGFSEALAHLIEAGSDAFLMPSRFEPCGLNQMYSLRYGTVPIVRNVGGLADSVSDPETHPEDATGFVFSDYRGAALLAVIRRALQTYHDRAVWEKLVRNGMQKDWSWTRSAQAYEGVYHTALERRRTRSLENRS